MLRLALAGWFLIIVFATTWPWSDFQGHSHWASVNLVPFGGRTDSIRDIALNVALFVPFGYLSVRQSGRVFAVAAVRAIGAALLLAGALETVQVYMHNHFPTMTDVISNGIGAACGAIVGRKR